MTDPSLLSGYPNCSEPMPVAAPVEEYILEQFMPVVGIEGANAAPMGIPLNVAMPNYMAEIRKRLGSSAETRLGALRSPMVSPNQSWLDAGIEAKPDPVDVPVADVAHALVTDRIVVGGQTLDLSGLGNVREALAQGRAAEVDLAVNGVVTTHRFIPMVNDWCNVPGEIALTHADASAALKSGRLEIPGLGFVRLPSASLNSLGRKLSGNGFAQVKLPPSSGTAGREILLKLQTSEPAAGADNATGSIVLKRREGPQSMSSMNSYGRGAGRAEQLPQFPFVLHVPINQRWELQGYTRGGLVNTFALAPQEDLVIEVFTWDRRKTGTESSTSFEAEFSNELAFTNKTTYESLVEAKNSNGWEAGFGVSASIPETPFSVDGHYGVSDKTDTTNKKTLQDISEATRKSSSKIKASRQTKVTESTETGREDRVTRHIRNPNAGRILHLDCFEILANYQVRTNYDFSKAVLCILIDYVDVLSNLTPTKLVALEGLLVNRVPEALRSGFDSARKLVAWDKICKYTCDSACDCDGPDSAASSLPAASGNPYEADVIRLMKDVAAAIQRLKQANGDDLAKSVGIPAAGYQNLSDDTFAAYVRNFQAYLYRELVLKKALSRFWNACTDFAGAANPDMNNAATLTSAAEVQPLDLLNGATAYASLGLAVVGMAAGLIGKYGLATPFLTPYLGFDDYGLDTAFRQFKSSFTAWKKIEDERKQPAPVDPNAPAAEPAPPARRTSSSDYSPEVLAEAETDTFALISYISANRSFYRTLLWRSLDPGDRIRFLGLFDSLNKYGNPNVVGFVGEKMAVEFNLSSDDRVRDWFEKNVLSRALEAASAEVTLPVGGVTMQSRVDNCDALEPYLVESRATELKRLAAIASQEDAEARRRDKRLDANQLDDPKGTLPALKLEVDNNP